MTLAARKWCIDGSDTWWMLIWWACCCGSRDNQWNDGFDDVPHTLRNDLSWWWHTVHASVMMMIVMMVPYHDVKGVMPYGVIPTQTQQTCHCQISAAKHEHTSNNEWVHEITLVMSVMMVSCHSVSGEYQYGVIVTQTEQTWLSAKHEHTNYNDWLHVTTAMSYTWWIVMTPYVSDVNSMLCYEKQFLVGCSADVQLLYAAFVVTTSIHSLTEWCEYICPYSGCVDPQTKVSNVLNWTRIQAKTRNL